MGFWEGIRSIFSEPEEGEPALYIPSDGPSFDLSDNPAAREFLKSLVEMEPEVAKPGQANTDTDEDW